MKYTDRTYAGSKMRVQYLRLPGLELFWHSGVPKGRLCPWFNFRWKQGDVMFGRLTVAWKGLAS